MSMLEASLWLCLVLVLLGFRWLFVGLRRGNIIFYRIRQSDRKSTSSLEDKLTAEERAALTAEQSRLAPLDGRD